MLGVASEGEQARSRTKIVTQNVRMETSCQNIHANFGPFVSVCGVCCAAAAHPGLEEGDVLSFEWVGICSLVRALVRG
jgi:hypothetical protein